MTIIKIDAEPNPISIALEATALIVIDMQKDFLYPGGYGEALGNDPRLLASAIAPAQRVLQAARSKKMMVVHTREGHLPDLSDCPDTKLLRWPEGNRIGDPGPMGRILIRGEMGHGIVDEMKPAPGETVIDKPGKNAFYKTDLDNILRRQGIKNLLITGVTTDVCCGTTISAANDHGYNAITLADCMAAYDPRRHTAAIDIIKAQGGIFGWVTDSGKVLTALMCPG
ncbi:MAG TPA: cysteine hydrolase [Dehalococcoidia bacterium]|nr:cysteine hydrolase [Dehalococcoidia bacterium]